MFTYLLAYQERQQEDRRAALNQMTEDASEDYAMALKRAPPGGRLLTALRTRNDWRRMVPLTGDSGWPVSWIPSCGICSWHES